MNFLLFGRSNTAIFVRHVLNDTDVLSLNKLCDMLKPFEYKWLCDKRFLSSGTSPLSYKKKIKKDQTLTFGLTFTVGPRQDKVAI